MLPKLNDTMQYTMVIPSQMKEVKFRPYLVKEEKTMMLALESNDARLVLDTIASTVESCLIDYEGSVRKLTTFDIEYMFLNIRGKSVGEVIELLLTCPDDGVTEVKVSIDVEDVNVEFAYGHTNKIKVSDDLWIEMKYPNLDSFSDPQEDIDDTFVFMAKSISRLYNDEDVWDSNTTTIDEFVHFLEQLSSKQFANIQKFFETMPSLRHKIKASNPKTGVEFDYVIEGLSNFFA